MIYISDFYAGADFLNEILAKIQCPLQFDKQYISCDCGYNKRSGRLFEYVLNDMRTTPEKQLHIGDNQYSDVEIPKSRGIDARHYLPEKEHEIRMQKEKQYAGLIEYGQKSLSFGGLVSKRGKFRSFYGFVHWIIESCIQDDIGELYFLQGKGNFISRFMMGSLKMNMRIKAYRKRKCWR